MDNTSDLHINCAVRRVLVRHWIDLGKLTMRTTRGVVRLSGALCRLSNAGGELNCGTMLAILSEIKHIGPVKRVTVDLTNWTSTDQGWQPLDSGTSSLPKTVAEAPASAHTAGSFNVYEVKEKPPEDTPDTGSEG